jgi:glycosyltransferase involved in cell wall biosynthesis
VLAQTRAPLEIIIVDDGSTDNTASVVARYHRLLRYFRQENRRGVGVTGNRRVAASVGEFIAFLDADGVWDVTSLGKTEPGL